MSTIRAIRGMNDILPEETPYWQALEQRIAALLAGYGYREIRLPIVEQTALFSRSIGEVTDIVEKEMYSFADRNGDSLTLRPEGTAGCVRAAIQNGLRYLARIQNRDGSWGDRRAFDRKYGYAYVGKTALCVLAFVCRREIAPQSVTTSPRGN